LAVSSGLTDSGQMVIHGVTHVRTPASINKVEDLALSQENKPWKQFTVKNCMTN